MKVLDQRVHTLADMLVPGQGDEVYDDYTKEMSGRLKVLTILSDHFGSGYIEGKTR